MALSAEQIAAHPALLASIRRRAERLVRGMAAGPAFATIFATRQRWLMAHAGLSAFFRRDSRDPESGISFERLVEVVERHQVASRNTADAFVKVLLKYGIAFQGEPTGDRRIRPLVVSPGTLEAVGRWATGHLRTLDEVSPQGRVELFAGQPDGLARLQPLIADGYLSAASNRQPSLSQFVWLNNGGLVMDWLVSSLDSSSADGGRIRVREFSVTDMSERLKLSRTHLTRKLRQAEASGLLGWDGKSGRSGLWVSNAFQTEYLMAQAERVAIVDRAFDAAFS